MKHESKSTPVEVMPGVFIPSINTIPSMNCVKKNGSRVYITDGPLHTGDEVEPAFVKPVIITEVIEQRPAMGDWSGESYSGMTPTYNLVRVL